MVVGVNADNKPQYRPDIDGLRAIAVLSVIFFHLGFLPEGYLGVDVFFVISGYLITSNLFNQSKNNTLKITQFYIKRIRRILPLLFFICTVSLILGYLLMLPDDLENLSQSVIASNLSFNNILLYITTGDYWAPANDYRPLLHTWSLGLEEQFYLVYPILFVLFKGNKSKYLLPLIILLTLISAYLFVSAENLSMRFYFLHFRFFELATGGILALVFSKKIVNVRYLGLVLMVLLIMLIASLSFAFTTNTVKAIVVTVLTALILALSNTNEKLFYHSLLSSKPIVFIGKISYSLYLWHFVIIAFARYSYFNEFGIWSSLMVLVFTMLLSVFSFYWIENRYRSMQKVDVNRLFLFLSTLFFLSTTVALFTYAVGGVYKDFDSLNIKKNEIKFSLDFFDKSINVHSSYNESARIYDADFVYNDKLNVLILGNSYARDLINIITNTSINNKINISYIDVTKSADYEKRFSEAEIIFISTHQFVNNEWILDIEKRFNAKINKNKLVIVGTKNFGKSNGIHHRRNQTSKLNYTHYYTKVSDDIILQNAEMSELWEEKYINLMSRLLNKSNEILVFTPDGKFISQDTAHLTKAGAMFFAETLNDEFERVISLMSYKKF